MTWARCICGSRQFDVGFDEQVPLKSPSRELAVGPACLACAQCGKTYLIAKQVPPQKDHHPPNSTEMVSLTDVKDAKLDPMLLRIERKMIVDALDHAGGNRRDAAAIIGISRSRLYRRIDALGIQHQI